MKKLLDQMFVAAIAGILFFPFAMYQAFAWGVVLFKFWGWFLTPALPMIPEISFGSAFMIRMFLFGFPSRRSKREKGPDIKTFEDLKKYIQEKLFEIDLPGWIVKPWLILFIGYLIHIIIK